MDAHVPTVGDQDRGAVCSSRRGCRLVVMMVGGNGVGR